MKKIFGITVAALVFVSLQSCTYDKQMLVPLAGCPDTVDVSFAAKVRPLLQANCFSCHGNGASEGNISLDSYDQVKQVAISGRLLGSISHSQGFAPMPQGAGKLDDCTITAVSTWIREGTQNN
ncbi:MAG TPA: c-type cytochrome domain-containing protein [Chitinophagaceae bacterium]|nr:c-type cytochrome domain-containing protein [Chitinophagaceae bacterium]